MCDSKKSTGRLAASGADSFTTTPISSGNCSVSKTSIVYEYDKSVEVKEEIIEERCQDGEHDLLSEKSKFDEKSIFADNKSTVKIENVYEYEETLEIKEEIIQDPVSVTGQKLIKKCEPTWNAVDTIEASSLADKKLRTRKKKKIQNSKPEPEKKFKCQKCTRFYKHKHSLIAHKKFECGITPRFICEFCDKRFKQKGNMSRHVDQMHHKTNSNQSKEKIQESNLEPKTKQNICRHQKTNPKTSQASYNCDKCSQSYSSLTGLHYHNLVKHASVKPQFLCDVCGYKANKKSSLSVHISSRHFKDSKTSQASYNCEKCSQSYSSLNGLRYHNLVKHAVVKQQFICDVCDYETKTKSSLSKHISSWHFKNKTSQASYHCDKCSQSYSFLSSLKQHNRLKHAAVKPEFTCDVCGYKTSMKSNLPKHISSRHFKKSKALQARHNCNKCSQSYSSLNGLHYHNLVKHAGVKPEFICDVCDHRTYMKYNLLKHIFSRHFKNSNTSQAIYI